MPSLEKLTEPFADMTFEVVEETGINEPLIKFVLAETFFDAFWKDTLDPTLYPAMEEVFFTMNLQRYVVPGLE
jgi:hypothetical protein